MERKLTRFLTLLVSLLVLVSVCTTTVFAAEIKTSDDPKCYIHGDVNGDGKLGTQDAIYTLYYAMWHDVDETLYPIINQEFDFTGDGKVSTKDALYLLWASVGDENYELEGDIHEYYKPNWVWAESEAGLTATLTFRCGCGELIKLTAAEKDITAVTTAATCVASGKVEYTAKVTYEGKEYTTEKPYVVEIPATAEGHNMVGEQGCETESVCSLCGHTLPALGHNWVLSQDETKTYASTCTEEGQQWYDCACGEHYTVAVGTVPHTHAFFASSDPVLKEGTTCTYVTTNTYKCVCGDEITSTSEYDKHSYKAVVTREATCVAAGVKTYICEHCGDENGQTEAIPVNADAHNWNDGVLDEATGITTHTCSVCGGEKTTVTVTKDEAVSKEQLANELQLENANVSLDEQTVADLDDEKEIKISITEADLDNTGLSAEQKEQVGDNTVYDFSMAYTDGTAITNFAGKVKVSLPYTLGEGEDIDSIDIWYIDDQGNPAQMKGTYANGYVTFETDHFSYYTVTRLTPAERCSRYGHIWIAAEKAATCTEEGYTKDVCQRCGSEANVKKISALEHAYVDASDAKAATCTEAGLKHQICDRCDHEVKDELVALGHNLVADEANSQKADCNKPGKVAKCCDRDGCDYVSVEELPQLKHDFGENPKETLYPDCTTGGYDHQKCDLCGQDVISNETAPLGHDYGIESWIWSEDKTAASAKLICKINPEHTAEVKAVVSVKSAAPSCASKGYVTYTALISHNKKEFTESITVETDALGHQTSGEWQTSGTGHYRICSVCGEKADQAGHTWNEVVTKETTCAEAGTRENTCIICGYTATETIPATGKHDLVGGECLNCDFTQDSCEHMTATHKPVDISGYDVCEGLKLMEMSCECGQERITYIEETNCEFGEETVTKRTLSDGTEITVHTAICKKCGFTFEYGESFLRLEEEICRGYYADYCCIRIGGEIVTESVFTYRSAMMRGDHPTHIVKETIDLGALGLCSGKLEMRACSCGAAYGGYYVDTECDWAYTDGKETCNVCGATRTYEYQDVEKADCIAIDLVLCTIQKDGQTVHSFVEKQAYFNHDYTVIKSEMDGETCEDGVTVYSVCDECGYKDTSYFTWHAGAMAEVTDLTGYGSCATEVHQYTCACGAEKFGYEAYNGQVANVADVAHKFELVSEDPKTGDSVMLCSKCNYTQTVKTTRSQKDENCWFTETRTFTYTDGKGHTYAYADEYKNSEHDFQSERVLLGSSCEDGIEMRTTCVDCGESTVHQVFYDHLNFEVATYDLTEYGMCGGTLAVYECPCKTSAFVDRRNNACRWEWLDGDEYSTTWRCSACGVTREEKLEVLFKIDDCNRREKRTLIFSKDDQELLKQSVETNGNTHRNVYSFEMLNPDQGCEGGYQITQTCLTCGDVNNWGDTWHEHEAFTIAREIVSVNQLCGDLELVTNSCPCGLDSWVNYQWTNGNCDFRWINGKDVCVNCGATLTETWTHKAVEGETCKQQSTCNIVIVRNGKTVCDFTYDMVTSRHKEKTTFNLLGETCDDGYTYTVSCSACGELLGEQNNVQYGCEHWILEIVTVASHEDICGDVTMEIAGCACGRIRDAWKNGEYGGCIFEHVGWDGISQRDKFQCRNCGLVRYSRDVWEHIKGTCTALRTIDDTYELNGKVIGSYKDSFVTEDHRTVATFNLWGETCDDGYDVYHTCVDCDLLTGAWEEYGHMHFQTGYYDLSDYGMCGGELWTYSCACGQENGGYDWNWDCQWEHKGYDDTTGTSTYYCNQCNTYRYNTEVGQRDPATCTYTGVETISFVRDDVTLLTFTVEYNHESHEMIADSVTLVNPEGTCEDGVIATEHCVDCGYTQTRTYTYHEDITTLRIDLSDGCGGELRFGGCACGENKFFHQGYQCQNMKRTDEWQEYDENNITHFFYQDECADCGLTIVRERYDIYSTTSCLVEEHENYTVTYRGQTYTHDRVWEWYSHKERVNTGAVLEAGASSCEDGVYIQWTCNYCGMSDQDLYEGHELVSRESIDLADYGSLCGATLNLYTCACGQSQRYDIGAGSECDIHRQDINHWIDGVINTSQYTSEGYRGTWSYSYLMKCAVSDPVACGMTIRMAEYWLNENCMAVEYQTWQLGYDEETGTYDRQITIKTGEQHAYHPYEETYFDEPITGVNGTRWTCPDCGSSGEQQWTYVNGIQTRFWENYVNQLYAVNGENRSRTRITEYGLVANDHNYVTRSYSEEVAADDTVEWWQEEYSNYDFSGECKRTRTYTDSDGYTETSVESAHVVTCRYFNDPEPTCSQDGMEHHVHDCVACGAVETDDSWTLEPTKHYWNWDYEKQVYVCSVCELESDVGATGSICLEDMTDADSAVYTIGYWNPENIDYVPKVSIILDDVTDDNEFVLSGIAFDYLNMKDHGVRALTFSKAEAQAAAGTAIANLSYSGSYAIRISFVPTTGDNTLDYAITFDSQNTAQ